MVNHELADRFAIAGPWVTGFEIAGEVYGNHSFIPRGEMERQMFQVFPDAKDILELGSCEGGRTRYLAQQARSVTGIEGRAGNLTRATFIRELFGLRNVSFVEANLEHGIQPCTADVVYCVGVLYHMPWPWELIQAMARTSPNIFLWTHIAGPEFVGFEEVVEYGPQDMLSGLSPVSLWPSRQTLLQMLKSSGYKVEILGEEDHKNGRAITLIGRG